VTAERLPMFAAVFPQTAPQPRIDVPDAYAKTWTEEAALIEIVRGRLEGLGPVTSTELARTIGLPRTEVDIALAALQAEGFAMRGRFSSEDEWCERRLLARIHRYTVKRLRAEIEPIEARDFLRFLFEWQRVAPEGRMEGPDAVGAILGQLEGFEAPASAWETEILPTRISEYEPAWLDEQCLAGRYVWTRLAHRSNGARKNETGPTSARDSGTTLVRDQATPARERGAAPVRSTPIALLARRNIKVWSSLSGMPDTSGLSVKARMVVS